MSAHTYEWEIPEREYARMEQRRGRRHAFETLDPRRTALVVIDMVAHFFEAGSGCARITPNVNRIAETLRAAGGVVAWVAWDDPGPAAAVWDEFYGPEVAALYRRSGGSGPVRQRIEPGLKTHEDDLYATKTATSAFFPGRSDLPNRLRARGIENVIITGTVTSVCCEASARDASTLGYRVVMVADACVGINPASHNATLTTVYRAYGDVRSTDEVVGLISG